MKRNILGIVVLFLLRSTIFSQAEIELHSKISKVTVFTKGAQIESEAKFEVPKGKCVLLLKKLSPYINNESIRIDGDGNYTILNTQLQNDYLNKLEKRKEINDLNSRIEQIQEKIEDENIWIKIFNEKLEYLNVNKTVTGKEQAINPEVYKSLYQIFSENTEKNTLEIQKRERIVKEYNKEIENLKNQLNSINEKGDLPSGTIAVTIESKQMQPAGIKISYMVEKANWVLSYDIRFLDCNKPLSISYKATIFQNTGVDWNDVKLKLSTAKTNISAQIPSLKTNYLHYYYPPRDVSVEQALQGRVAGIAISNNSGITGASSDIRIRGLGSVESNDPLYIVDGNPQKNLSSIDPENIESVDVIKDASASAIYGSQAANGLVIVTTRKNADKSSLPFTLTTKNETSNEYVVEGQQSIKSENKVNTLTFKETSLNATYEYQAIPKLSKNVYLIGKIADWYNADLTDGEATIYMENSYVGKSKIVTQQFSDTLDISFGIDNNIMVNREKIKDFSESQFLGSTKKETFAWKLTIRNNKTYSIKVKLFDQAPVSSLKDIEVEVLEISGGNMNQNSGKIVWSTDLNPGEQKQFILKYSVKYPKDKTVLAD